MTSSTLTQFLGNCLSFLFIASVLLFLSYGMLRGIQKDKEARLRRRRHYS